MAKKMRIITDSCCTFSQEKQEQLGISFISSRIQIGNEIIRETEDIDVNTLSNTIENEKTIPRILHPTADEIFQIYSMLYPQFDNVLSIHLSSDLSPNYTAAKKSQDLLYDTHIEVIDSKLSEAGLQSLTELLTHYASNQVPFQTIQTQIQNIDRYFYTLILTPQPSFLRTNVNVPIQQGFSLLPRKQYHLYSLVNGKLNSVAKANFNQIQLHLHKNAEQFLMGKKVNVQIYHGLDTEKAKAIENVIQGKLDVDNISMHTMPLSGICRYGTHSILVGFSFIPESYFNVTTFEE